MKDIYKGVSASVRTTLMQRYRMDQNNLHLVFIDSEKACDRVPREILWKSFEKKGVKMPIFEL